ncbi:protein of unknown function, DUF4106 family [Trichomonas vaginalis G3]|uniref:protein of unknown function, DUF4106 family n=1 Tax=Trichomonas vaginalis (strain ATCC PRA-98 / G3) TaxID=412133 RepID=UPI002156E98B|nr:protein of unknown function, DUF4106 family [Trichomonas vaginalis G3]KAI5482870.1 protein of unknown function, DUF4106 family [Trichomonas vaginalis G3]
MDKLCLKSLNRKLRKESCKQYAKTQIQTMTKSLGYRLPELGDQSPKAKRTWEIYNILGEHEAKMQQLEAEGKLPKATPKKKSRTK